MSAQQEEVQGAVVELDEEQADVEETPEGGAIVRLEQANQVGAEADFYANIVEEFDEPLLDKLALDLLEKIDYDRKAREKHDKKYEEGIKRTGLGDEAPGGAQFQGASKTVHPMLMKACVEFGAREIKELFPPSGPVKDFIAGTPDKKRVEKARRISKYMNWQLTKQMKEARFEVEQCLPQTALGGSQYLMIVHDTFKNRPVLTFVQSGRVLLPFAASSLYSSERVTYIEDITRAEYERRIRAGIYRDVDGLPPAQVPEPSGSVKANQKVEGKQPNPYNEDGVRRVYRVAVHSDIEADDEDDDDDDDAAEGDAPYLISVDESSRRVLAVVRNWERDDDAREGMDWIIDMPFVPWDGAQSVGFAHMIGSLAGSTTGIVRALLDAAHTSNLPGMVGLKGMNMSGQSLQIDPTQITLIEGTMGQDDIRKLLMALPFNPPSAVLLQMLGILTEYGESVVRMTFESLAEANQNMPVGTTLALIEQGLKVYGSIHSRLHDAMSRLLAILYRINRMYLTDEEVKFDTGEHIVYRADFQGPMDVIPVSDPEIFSDIQRFAQMQVVADRAKGNPLYDQRAVELMILQRSKIPDAERLLVPVAKPDRMNAVAENVAASMGKPVAAFPDQDHLGHLQAHLDYMQSPVLGYLPIIAPTLIPIMLGHIRDHIAMWYATHVYEQAREAVQKAGVSFGGAGDMDEILKDKDPRTRAEVDKLLASLSPDAVQAAAQTFQKVPPIIEQAMQVMQKYAPQPPADPAVAVMREKTQSDAQAKQAQLQQRSQETDKKSQTDLAKETLRQDREDRRLAAEIQAEAAVEAERQRAETARKLVDAETRQEINTADNATALSIAEAEVLDNQKIGVSTGSGINPQP
jgi:hypothetical protein